MVMLATSDTTFPVFLATHLVSQILSLTEARSSISDMLGTGNTNTSLTDVEKKKHPTEKSCKFKLHTIIFNQTELTFKDDRRQFSKIFMLQMSSNARDRPDDRNVRVTSADFHFKQKL